MRQWLFTPGPIMLPQEVLLSGAKQMISHRSQEFSDLFISVVDKLKKLMQVENGVVLLFPSSGTGVMEASVKNFFNMGDKVAVFSCGVFGDRYAEIAKVCGLNVVVKRFEDGKPVEKDEVLSLLSRGDFKAVFFTHNETSTALLNDIKTLSLTVKDFNEDILVFVDAVSSLGGVELYPQKWGIDVVVSSSQKALMTPPGIGIVYLSEYAFKKLLDKPFTYYFDFKRAFKYLSSNKQTPYTPAVSLLYSLDKALSLILKDVEAVFKKHKEVAKKLRDSICELGFKLLPLPDYASPTVSAFFPPQGVDAKELAYLLKKDFGITIAGGQGNLKGKIIRIAHMGDVGFDMVFVVCNAIKSVIETYFK